MSKPKLTVKQAKFVKAKAEGKTGVEAAMIAYDTTDVRTAAAISSENLTKPNIQEVLNNAMEKAGITVEAAIAPIGEALRNDELDMRLKGSDRALKLMLPKAETTTNINFGTVINEMKDKYAD
jgi:phage terminase small subunit